MTCKYFLPLCGLPFHSLDSVPWCTKGFNFDEVHLAYFFFCCFWCHIREITAKFSVMRVLPCVFF